jgi:hypothetical protein
VKREKIAVVMLDGVRAAAISLMLTLFYPVSGNAQQRPQEGCRPVSKTEYDAAKRDYLLTGRFGAYVRTGRFWRRYYWYCR